MTWRPATVQGASLPASDVAAAAPAETEKKSKKVKRIALQVTTKGVGITPQELMEAQEAEGNMQHMDNLIKETAEAMNALESAVYKLRSDMSERLAAFLIDSDKEKFGEDLTKMEDWLYDEGFDAEKAVYVAKRKELTDAFGPAELRCKEAEQRPDALAALESVIATYAGFAASSDEQYVHISAEEKQKVSSEVAQAQAWFSDIKAQLDALPGTGDPPVRVSDVEAKAAALDKLCKPIMETPKPLPMEPEAVTTAGAPDGDGGEPTPPAEAAVVEGGTERVQSPGEESAVKDDMDVD